MINRDLIVEILISLHDKKTSKKDLLAELHDATGMLRAANYQAGFEMERVKEIISASSDYTEQHEVIKEKLELALDMFDREFDLRKKK